MYQIHEVCERCHLSRKAIRLYEEKGLLHPDRIQGNRMYNKEDVVRLQCISYYRGLGFSLEQIQQLLHGSSEKCLKELLMTQKKQLNQKLEEKQEQLRAVNNVIHAIRQHEELNIQTVNHDMKSPVGIAGTYLGLVDREGMNSMTMIVWRGC